MIAVGQLDTIIKLQSPTTTADVKYGGIGDTEYEQPSGLPEKVWAYLIWKSGNEKEQAEQMTGSTIVEFYIRWESYKENIMPNWRIQYDDTSGTAKYYYIEKIQHIDGRHKMTKLTATQKDNN